jgi:hypothetical protein
VHLSKKLESKIVFQNIKFFIPLKTSARIENCHYTKQKSQMTTLHDDFKLPSIFNTKSTTVANNNYTSLGNTANAENLSFAASLSPQQTLLMGTSMGGSSPRMNNLSPTAGQLQQQSSFQQQQQPAATIAYSSATYGDFFGATLHFWLESIVARCRCDRVALFLPHPKHHTLVRVAMVGPTAQPVSSQNQATALFSQKGGDTPGTAGPVTAAVLQTGVAANLSQVAQEDGLDCPGTTPAKTALVVPIKPLRHGSSSAALTGANAAVGVLFAVNKLGGSQVFSSHDQYVLVSIAPSIAYMAETYPVDFAAHRFDPSPLHRIIAQYRTTSHSHHQHHHQDQNNNTSNKTSRSPRSNTNNNNNLPSGRSVIDEATQANLVLPEKPPQLVYDQSGSESMIPYVALTLEEKTRSNYSNTNARLGGLLNKQKSAGANGNNNPVLVTADDERNRIFNQSKPTLEELIANHQQEQQQHGSVENSLSTAQQIVSVGDFVNRMEQCWRDAVSRCIATERELTLRNAQVVDAHSILHRKQKRLEILKDVLVETLEKKL